MQMAETNNFFFFLDARADDGLALDPSGSAPCEMEATRPIILTTFAWEMGHANTYLWLFEILLLPMICWHYQTTNACILNFPEMLM